MAEALHVSGRCTVKYNGNTLGKTTGEGANATIVNGARPVYASNFGPHVPAAVLNLGRFAKVSMELVIYDEAQLDNAAKYGRGGGTDIGTIGALGNNMLASTATLIISGDNRVLSATKAIIMDDDIELTQIGPLETHANLIFTCFPTTSAATGKCIDYRS